MAEMKVRMDRSKDFATVHGDRAPGDTHAAVHFYQGGLPFDAEGLLIPDHPDFEPGEDQPSAKAKSLRKAAERLLNKAAKKKLPTPPSDGEAIDPDASEETDDENEDETAAEVNLEAWLRGDEFNWNDVQQAIAARYRKRISAKADAVEFLVNEKVVSIDQLAPKYRKLLG